MDDFDAIISRTRAGDAAAPTTLVLATERDLRRFIAARAGDPDLVEETVQATYVTAFTGLDSYRGPDAVPSWLKGIALNHLRREWRRRRRLTTTTDARLDAVLAAQWEDSFADDDVFSEERVARLPGCLERLSQAARSLIDARYRRGVALAELASSVGKAPGTVATALCRIRADLRRCLEQRQAKIP